MTPDEIRAWLARDDPAEDDGPLADEFLWGPPLADEFRWRPSGRYLPTMPGTYLEFSSAGPGKRGRPCWRCRLWLRWPPWRRHWTCRKLRPVEYL